MLLLHVCSYVAAAVAFAFCTLSLASGLLYIAEVIEEHTRLAKVIGKRLIYGIIAFHVLLLLTDRLPLHLIALGIVCHATYLTNLSSSTWPYISLTSWNFLASCLLVILDHFAWFFYFAERAKQLEDSMANRFSRGRTPYRPAWDASEATRGRADEPLTFMDVATFFGVCVWLVPFFLFLSLSANDNVLPSQAPGSLPPIVTTDGSSAPASSPRGSILKTLLINPLLSLVPTLSRGVQGRSSRSQREGLIASPRLNPPTPNEEKPQFAYSPYPARGMTSSPGPHLSPVMNNNGPFAYQSPTREVRPPPLRRSTTTASGYDSPPKSAGPRMEFAAAGTSSGSMLGYGNANKEQPLLRRVASGTVVGQPNGGLGISQEDSSVHQGLERSPSGSPLRGAAKKRTD